MCAGHRQGKTGGRYRSVNYTRSRDTRTITIVEDLNKAPEKGDEKIRGEKDEEKEIFVFARWTRPHRILRLVEF